MKYLPHPISEAFPLMTEEEFAILKEDIQANGLNRPILIYEEMTLDGRGRQRACLELGIEPKFETITENGLQRAISENFIRRHLSISQRAAISMVLYDILKKAAINSRGYSEPAANNQEVRQRQTAYKVGKVFGIGAVTVHRVAMVKKRAPHLLKRIASGELTVAQAVVMLPGKKEKKLDEKASNILKEFDTSALQLPTPFDSYEKIFNEFINKLNDAGFNMQVVFSNRKKYIQIVPMGQNFINWANCHHDYEFRRALAVVAREKLAKKIEKKAA